MMDSSKEPLELVKVVICRCVETDGVLIKDLASFFYKSDAISRGQKKKICKNVKEGFLSAAAEALTDSIHRHDIHLWKANLVASLVDKEIPGDGRMVWLLQRLLGDDDPVPAKILYLIHHWKELEKLQNGIFQHAKSTWPEDAEIPPSDKNWILCLILKCCMEKDNPNVLDFVSSVKELVDKHTTPTKTSTEAISDKKVDEKTKKDGKAKKSIKTVTNDELFDCAKTVICKCTVSNMQSLKDLSQIFLKNDLISKAQRKAVIKDKTNDFDKAAENLFSNMHQHSGKLWKKKLIKAVSHKGTYDIPVVPKLLWHTGVMTLGVPQKYQN